LRPFEFIILFFSFIYTLALTHLLLATVQMVRHRRRVTFSWPHAIWMANAMLILSLNWVGLWDFHRLTVLPLSVIAVGFVLVVGQYLICALVAPDFETADDFDLRRFHAREGRGYMFGFLALILFAAVINLAAEWGEGLKGEADQNGLIFAMAPPAVAALAFRAPWIQVIAPLMVLCLSIAEVVIYYPALR
jgi:hypothetical protein